MYLAYRLRYTSNALAPASISGWPTASMMILVNSTNTNAGAWIPFNPNPTVNLGSGDGLKTVTFYFNCLSNIVSSYTVRIWLDTTPPAIHITAPASNTVDEPLLQLQGYAPEELAGVTYDISNSAGCLTNQPAVVTGRFFDTNLFQFTTNTFQAFDIDLTPGTNRITLHAQDIAGNVTTTNLTYTLDYSAKTNPPGVALYWPTNGAVICGSGFTWRGWVQDPTVTIAAQIVNTNGDTNALNGIVERNGNFWVDNMPLASGTNWLTLTATDAVGNMSSTNIAVVQSTVNLAMTSIPDITNQTTVEVDGTVDDGYTVYVNGVMATGGANWSAYNVPVNGTGTSVFEAVAVLNSQTNSLTGGGGGTNSSLQNPGNPVVLSPVNIHSYANPSLQNPGNPVALATLPTLQAAPDTQTAIICTNYVLTSDVLWAATNVPWWASDLTNHEYEIESWQLASPGYDYSTSWGNYMQYASPWGSVIDTPAGFQAYDEVWDKYGNSVTTNYTILTNNDYTRPSGTDYSSVDMTGTTFTPEESVVNSVQFANTTFGDDGTYCAQVTALRKVASAYVLRTGGKAASHRQAVFQLNVTAQNVIGWPYPIGVDVPYNKITVMNKPLGKDNNLSVSEPNGVEVPVPVDVPVRSDN
jgi:hypothetical protein